MRNDTSEIIARFSMEEKAQFFDDFVARCLGTGTFNIQKTEAEVIFFHCYLENLKRIKSKNSDLQKNVQEKNTISDYVISFELGITQSKVRNLKEKEYIIYKNENLQDIWKQSFLSLLGNIKLNKKTNNIEVLIPDNVLMMELRNFAEELGLYDEITLNPKVFKCPVASFIKIYDRIEGNGKDSYAILKKQLEQSCQMDDLPPESFLEALKKTVGEHSLDLIESLPLGNYARKIISFLIDCGKFKKYQE